MWINCCLHFLHLPKMVSQTTVERGRIKHFISTCAIKSLAHILYTDDILMFTMLVKNPLEDLKEAVGNFERV